VNVKKEHLTAITAASYAFGILSFINAPKPRSITEPSVVEGSGTDSIPLHLPQLEVTSDSFPERQSHGRTCPWSQIKGYWKRP